MDIKQLCDELRSLLQLQMAELPRDYIWQAINISDLFDLSLLLNQPYRNEPLHSVNIKPFLQFLSRRWNKIIGTDLAYPHASKELLNTICILLADRLEEVTKISRYQLLMPTIKESANEISGMDLNEKNLAIHEIILSDNNDHIIDVAATLDFACEDGILKHTQLFDGRVEPLTMSEAKRVVTHSKEAKEFFIATIKRLRVVSAGNSFGAMLNRLAKALMRGGTKSKGGTEFDSGHNANEGIACFYVWLETLENAEKQKLFAAKSDSLTNKTFKDIWERLAHYKNMDYQNVLTCVEINAGNIQKILDDNKWLFDYYPKQCANAKAVAIKVLDEEFRVAKANLTKAIHSDNYTVTSSYKSAGRLRLYHQTIHNNDVAKTLSLEEVPGITADVVINLQHQLLKHIVTLCHNHPENTSDILTNIFIHLNAILINTLSFADLIQIMHYLPDNVRSILLDRIFVNLPSLMVSGKYLLELIPYIPADDEVAFIAYFDDLTAREILIDTQSIFKLLSLCDENNRSLILENWINNHHDLIRDVVIKLIILLPALDKHWIVDSHLGWFLDAVQNVNDICSIAEALLYPNIDEEGQSITYVEEKTKFIQEQEYGGTALSNNKVNMVPEALIQKINVFIIALKPRLSSIIKDAEDYEKLCKILPNDTLVEELRQLFPQYRKAPYVGISDEAMKTKLLEMRTQLHREHPQSYRHGLARLFSPAAAVARENLPGERNDKCSIM